jgi:hypothetical protein
VVNIEYFDGSWLFAVRLSYYWLTEEFCGCNKEVLFVFYDGYCWSINALCFGFISPEICELTLTYTFLQAADKKIPVM